MSTHYAKMQSSQHIIKLDGMRYVIVEGAPVEQGFIIYDFQAMQKDSESFFSISTKENNKNKIQKIWKIN